MEMVLRTARLVQRGQTIDACADWYTMKSSNGDLAEGWEHDPAVWTGTSA